MINDIADSEFPLVNLKWETPILYGVGHFTDFQLYEEALLLAKSLGEISIESLLSELPQKVKGLILIETISNTTINDLLRELQHFKFIKKTDRDKQKFHITSEGYEYLYLLGTDKEKARDMLLKKMQEIFVTPAWFIERMWTLNPQGQGELVIPTPIKSWRPESKVWDDYRWYNELEMVCCKTYDVIKTNLPGAFPIDKTEWIESVKEEYERLGLQQPRSKKNIGKKSVLFAPRARLSLAMKNISVHKLFSRVNPQTKQQDFPNKRSEMTHRAFSVWCPRLENLNLLFYTDYNPVIPGRIIFPLASFKESCKKDGFKEKSFIRLSDERVLYVHDPDNEIFFDLFKQTLIETYQRYYNMQSIMYVSIQDIRDELCRLLRISPQLFELFLQRTYDQSVKRDFQYYISLETDLREDMKIQLNRRGVFINGRMYSLIAIKPF